MKKIIFSLLLITPFLGAMEENHTDLASNDNEHTGFALMDAELQDSNTECIFPDDNLVDYWKNFLQCAPERGIPYLISDGNSVGPGVCGLDGMMALYDGGERLAMQLAAEARLKRNNGFEGCANQEKCGFGGYYAAEYSPEGLCNKCELEQFSERYVSCPFCQTPCHKDDTCGFGCEHVIKYDLIIKPNKEIPEDASFTLEEID